MTPFDWSDFLAPLDPEVLASAFVIGVGFGVAMRALGWWGRSGSAMIVAGIVFYIPLSLIRSMQGSQVWERFLATIIVWAVFVAGGSLGAWLKQRRTHGRP